MKKQFFVSVKKKRRIRPTTSKLYLECLFIVFFCARTPRPRRCLKNRRRQRMFPRPVGINSRNGVSSIDARGRGGSHA